MNSRIIAGAGIATTLALSASLARAAEPPGPFPLDDTGMQHCVDADGAWTKHCANTGQDAAYGRDATERKTADGHAGFAYRKISVKGKDLGQDAPEWRCVVDKVTGLMWEVKGEAGGLDDADRVFTNWGDGRVGDTSTLVTAANEYKLCGGTQWRLPTLLELQTLLNYGVAAGPAIDADYFPRTREKWYWTAEGYADDPEAAWGVFFNSSAGGDGAGKRSFKLAVRLVHGERAVGSDRYVFANDEVTDRYTKLIWRRCAVGQSWTGSDCVGDTTPFEWRAALGAAKKEAERSGQAWRLPNPKELSTLADRTYKEPAVDLAVFPNVGKRQWYWTSTPFAADATQAWTVDFTGAYTQTYPTTGYPLGFRLVRNVP